MQSEAKPRESAENAEDDATKGVPPATPPVSARRPLNHRTPTTERCDSLEIKDEPSSPANDSELVRHYEREEDADADDGDEAARLLLDVVRREAIERDPRQKRDLQFEVRSQTGLTRGDRRGHIDQESDPEAREICASEA